MLRRQPNIFKFSKEFSAVLSIVTCAGCGHSSKVMHSSTSAHDMTFMQPGDMQHEELLFRTPDQPLNPKRLRVGVVGMPNVGKSTLINTLVNRQLLPTSSRIDTTRANTLAVLTSGETQIEFQDSPGIHNRKKSKKVTGTFRSAHLPAECIRRADLCMVVADLTSRRLRNGFLQPELLLHLTKFSHVPAILVLNKVDCVADRLNLLPLINILTAGFVDGVPCKTVTKDNDRLKPIALPAIESKVIETIHVKKTYSSATEVETANKTEAKLLNQLRSCHGWPNFKDVFVISALEKEETEKLKNYLFMKALSEPWKFHSDVLTDASPYDIVTDTMRSAMLENLAEEVPYYTKIEILDWNQHENGLQITLELLCRKQSHVLYIKRVAPLLKFAAKRRLLEIFNTETFVNLVVSMGAKNW
ncbi:GTPase Era, mitochondrial-like [Clavelina lepadiformis]|uniref:GTPase Era, mitochondrial n=1 Tax=Clavelina lepadiformis TaxID=159417 RepID=A0ABP0FKD6_CLALP